MSNGSKREQIYKCGWLWQTGHYAKTKRTGERGMREGWEYKKLGDVCQVVTGSTPKTNISEYWDGNYPWVTPAELKGDVYISDTARHITEEAIAHTNLTLLPIGTVLLSSRAPIGKVAITTIEMYCNQGFKNLICSDAINNKYLYLWLSGKTEYLNSLGRGATFKEISRTIVENVIIPLPPLSIQKSIVTELDKINELIRLKREQLKDYDNLAQSIFYEMFGDPVVNEKGWIVKTIGDVCSLKSGDSKANKSPKGTLPYVKVGDMNLPGNENYITCSSTYVDRDYNKRGIFPIGSILFPKRGGAILTNKKRMAAVEICCDLNTMGVIPSEVLNKHYLFQWFKILDLGTICSGSTILQLNNCDIAPLLIQIPPLTLQQTFAKRIELIEQQKAEIQSTIADLETLLASRMQYWFD